MLAVQPPEDQNSTAPAGEEASPLEEAAVIIFSPPEYNYFELGPWEDIAGCWNSWPNATWSCPDPFCCGADIYYAARIAFTLSPTSASCERVFAQLKLMFGEQQITALADYVQAALMLRINKRRVG